MATPDRRAERGDVTRAQIIRVATELFSSKGYAEVGTNELVRAAGTTRGALYHHFPEKKDVFRAVLEQQQSELLAVIVSAMDRHADPWERIVSGIDTFFNETVDRASIRIGLVDGPAVLGWNEWSQMHAEYWMGLIESALSAAMAKGELRSADPHVLAHLLDGAFIKAALLVANAEDQEQVRRDARRAVMLLIEGLRT